jgi:hypothetical protein
MVKLFSSPRRVYFLIVRQLEVAAALKLDGEKCKPIAADRSSEGAGKSL